MDNWQSLDHSFQALDMEPLRVTCQTNSHVLTYQPLHLDSILAYAVVERVTAGEMLPANTPFFPIPLPLAITYTAPNGARLYASHDLIPNHNVRDVVYLHRRAPEPHHIRQNIKTTTGRHKEKRTAMPAIPPARFTADVVGNADAIMDLLDSITSIGKKHVTYGSVKSWSVERINEFRFMRNKRAMRPIPISFLLDEFGSMPLDCRMMAFSPPYWHEQTKTLCLLPDIDADYDI